MILGSKLRVVGSIPTRGKIKMAEYSAGFLDGFYKFSDK
jgi:hypothetical protein